MRNRFGILLSVCLLILGSVAQAAALPLILDFVGGVPASPAGDTIVGWEFSVSDTKTIGELALWDEGADGLANSHDVGLWTLGGILLASTIITNASTPVLSSSPDGRWLFNSIALVVLTPGTYVLGATFLHDDPDAVRLGTVASEISGVTFVQARQKASTSTLAFPDQPIPAVNDGAFGPNAGLVPEPARLLLLGLGLAGIAASRFSRRRPA